MFNDRSKRTRLLVLSCLNTTWGSGVVIWVLQRLLINLQTTQFGIRKYEWRFQEKTKSTKCAFPNRFVMIVFGKQILRKNIEYQLMSDCLFKKTNVEKKPMYMVIVIRKRYLEQPLYKQAPSF